MLHLYLDADGCPVREEACRVARRCGLEVTVVSNSGVAVPEQAGLKEVVVGAGSDAADDWIVDHVAKDDVVVSADIPLAARCLAKGARVLDPRGRTFTPETIGEALATRELLMELRGSGEVTGGPAPFGKRDRSRFLQALDEVVQAVRRSGARGGK